ncbi:hypothetical protein [Agromyces kandeliae]|uniref:Uncharacterized protein n=1 Tax=Agromyces kandeliae TaxID=2666141 RepID=A0A6L5QYT1_9MICO|nr:hypothetical protein [Agromyces kandeliae]MRX42966.1 hypothetical protein [Agromyces kandeliae]
MKLPPVRGAAQVAIGMLAIVAVGLGTSVDSAPAIAKTAPPPPTLSDPPTSAVTDLLSSIVKGAGGQVGSTLAGWVLPSAGSANQDVAVLDQISTELDAIEQTLTDIESEIAALTNAVDKLDCDTWIQSAEPMVDAISNLWDPNAASSGPLGGSVPQQSYQGIVAEAQNNTVTVADMQVWADQVLNNNNEGIGGKSVQDYLEDLATTLIAPAANTGLLQSCLSQPANLPTNYAGQTDDVYYNTVIAPLIGYYETIQIEGITMVVEAMNFEAWQAADSPTSTVDTITNLPETICGSSATGDVLSWCENADWAVLGEDGQSGERGRIADQLTFGGAPYTTDPTVNSQPVHLYVGSTTLWASDPSVFNSINSDSSCPGLNSNAPCGILAGTFSDTAIGGSYGGYGTSYGGTWGAAPLGQIQDIYNTGPSWGTYTNGADYLMSARGFSGIPVNTIFVTNYAFTIQPFSNVHLTTQVYAFMDTGFSPGVFYPIYDPQTAGDYFNSFAGLQVPAGSNDSCTNTVPNPALPPASANDGFYQGTSTWCGIDTTGDWTSGPPGWTTTAAKSHPQFRLPVLDVTALQCADELNSTNPFGAYTMCGDNFYAWLDALVPPAEPRQAANLNNGVAHGKSGLMGGQKKDRTIYVGDLTLPSGSDSPSSPLKKMQDKTHPSGK